MKHVKEVCHRMNSFIRGEDGEGSPESEGELEPPESPEPPETQEVKTLKNKIMMKHHMNSFIRGKTGAKDLIPVDDLEDEKFFF